MGVAGVFKDQQGGRWREQRGPGSGGGTWDERGRRRGRPSRATGRTLDFMLNTTGGPRKALSCGHDLVVLKSVVLVVPEGPGVGRGRGHVPGML